MEYRGGLIWRRCRREEALMCLPFLTHCSGVIARSIHAQPICFATSFRMLVKFRMVEVGSFSALISYCTAQNQNVGTPKITSPHSPKLSENAAAVPRRLRC